MGFKAFSFMADLAQVTLLFITQLIVQRYSVGYGRPLLPRISLCNHVVYANEEASYQLTCKLLGRGTPGKLPLCLVMN